MSSVMGEIMFVGLRSDKHEPFEVRDAAEWTVRRRLLAIQGIAQVVPIGGGMRQYQVAVDPDKLRRHRVTLEQVGHAIETSNQNTTGGFAVRGPQQNLVRGLGRLRSADDLRRVVVATRERYVTAYERLAGEPLSAWLERVGATA